MTKVNFATAPDVLNVSQTAQLLGIDRQTVRRMLCSGIIYGKKTGAETSRGTKWLVPKVELENWLTREEEQ